MHQTLANAVDFLGKPGPVAKDILSIAERHAVTQSQRDAHQIYPGI